jgi:hypothetical protein
MARPTEQQVALYHLPLKDYPEHGPGSARYPRPRKRKGAPLTPEELAAGELEIPAAVTGAIGPTPHNWFAQILTTGGIVRTTVVSEAYTGFGLIRSINLAMEGGTNAAGGIALLVSADNSGEQDAGANLTPPSGVSVLDRTRVLGGGTVVLDLIAGVWPEASQFTENRPLGGLTNVRYAIRLPRFYLKVTGRAHTAEDVSCRMMVNFLTDLSEADIARYL